MTDQDAPLYLQIATRLKDDIQSGRLKAGEKIASERVLAEDLGVSRMTARQALRHLVNNGLLEARVGQGTFVGANVIDQKLHSLTGFTEEMSNRGRQVSSIVVLSETRQADPQCRAALKLPMNALVQRLVRVRLVDGMPVARETTDIRADKTPGLLDLADFASQSVYQMLRSHFGLLPTTAEQTLAASVASNEIARSLGLTDGAAVLNLTRLTFDQHGQPIEFVRSVYRGDAFVMKVDLVLDERITQ
ncbi:GntR family transcriptional regulator [Rhizobium alvei]|uniref:GntR family transcriptional regulator n=1 Tax=Rhizobium alvei TaxID=1132659 RepID=A0ABT8YI55_9HYPH|nr:GntR family transcriptional regulator [Rhizobium alvei]MDO6963375.1 GntR family transcriptional regulator [Rhizobium alvei]